MISGDEFAVGYRLLDDELVDCDDRRCGRVDDVEFEGEPGKPALISAVLSGAGTWPARLPRRFERLARRLFGYDVVRVPWEEIDDIGEVVRLKRRGQDLGLGAGDDHVGRIVERIPGSAE